MDRQIKHPPDIPVEITTGGIDKHFDDNIRKLGDLALRLRSKTFIKIGTSITINYMIRSPFSIIGVITYCRKGKNLYNIRVKFTDPMNEFRMKLIEQVCHIEHYRREIRDKKGKTLTGQQAAVEWIHKYAKDFAK